MGERYKGVNRRGHAAQRRVAFFMYKFLILLELHNDCRYWIICPLEKNDDTMAM